MAGNFYLGDASTPSFAGVFSPTTGGTATPGKSNVRVGSSGNMLQGSSPAPFKQTDFGWGQPSSVDTTKNNTVGAQAIRPFGDPKGFDPAYLQNLTTSTGGNFARPADKNAVSFDPLGNLADITKLLMSFGNPSPMQGYGNAPTPGLPQNLLQWAQAFNPTALTPATAPPKPTREKPDRERSR